MHIFFSGIGGYGIGPLALITHQAGFEVSGSDKQVSSSITYLRDHGIENIVIGQSLEQIDAINKKTKIDWFVYSSAITLENDTPPEIQYCIENKIKHTKRDEFLNYLLKEKGLNLIAVSGTHGKSTTTAMIIWLFLRLDMPISYSIGAKINFGDYGSFNPKSKYFIYEADEFDRNFLSFNPHLSVISGVSWDHHEIFPTKEDYINAFQEFLTKSETTLLYKDAADYLGVNDNDKVKIVDSSLADQIKLYGRYNRLDALLALKTVQQITNKSDTELIKIMDDFPGLSRRMEEIVQNLYSDYAHTPEKIKAAINVAEEIAQKKNQKIYVIYEPLTNRRQHYIKEQYVDCFDGVEHIYWVPSYLAREMPEQALLSPKELINYLGNPSIAETADLNQQLIDQINLRLKNGDMVMALSGGGGNSLDEWLRANFKN
jgi:UDP-N-acetylmuramate--alanine ligase